MRWPKPDILAARVAAAGPGARRSALLGALDFLAGRAAVAEDRLLAAWQAHDRARDASVGAAAATQLAVLCLVAGRITEAIEWGERAAAAGAAPPAVRHRALGVLAIALSVHGRGPEGLARLAFLPAAPAEVPRVYTDTLVLRGMARVWAEDLAGAIADLSTAAARLRAGVPLRGASQCLSHLAVAEYHLGYWDDAVMHAELAVSLARDADRVWDLGYLHTTAAVVPALRGDWEVASAHVRMATEAAQAVGDVGAVGAAATARAFLATARGDLEGVADAAAALRAAGGAQFLSLQAGYNWRSLEIDALIGLARPGQAEKALAELEALSPAGPPSALVAAARLRGDLAAAAGHQRRRRGGVPDRLAPRPGPADATGTGPAGDLRRPPAARRRPAAAGRRPAALGPAAPDHPGRPALPAGLRPGTRRRCRARRPETAPGLPGLTPAEQAVARLVGTGRTNRQAAAELYVSVKTVEFHLGHIFDKLGIRSRKDLITRISATLPPHPAGNLGS